MANLQVIENITGWFDVKVFNDRISRENWKLKGDDDNISFTATFEAGSQEAVQFAAHGKPYTDNAGNNRVRVTFKIGGRCRWYDEQAQPCAKPTNADLDGKKFEVSIQYNELAGDPNNQLSPRGYWVNAIQFREADTNPFTAMVGAAAPVIPPQAQPQQYQYQQQQQQQQQQMQMQQQMPIPPMFGEDPHSTPLPF